MNNEITLPHNFIPRSYQIPLWKFMDSTDGPRRAIDISHRRTGKDLNAWNILIRETQKRVGTYWYLFPEAKMARRTIWEGKTNDGTPFLSYIPPELIVSRRNNDMYIKLTNGSDIHLLGSDRYDSLVGSNPVGVVMSEYALSDPRAYEYVRPILAANDGWFIANTTPRGRNHAFDMFKMAANDPNWFCQILTVDDTRKQMHDPDTNQLVDVPIVPMERVDQERREGMPEELVQQEYYCSFDAGQVGSYYSEAMERCSKEDRIILKTNLFDPERPVYTACDIGVSDYTSIWYFQIVNNKINFIEYNEFEGKSIIETAYIIQGDFDSPELEKYLDAPSIDTLRSQYSHHKNYKYQEHFAPHDIRKRDQGTAISSLVTARQHGLDFTVLPIQPVQAGINNVRKILPHAYFYEPKTRHGMSALRDYRKSYDTTRKMFSDTPYHNWASHGADAMRYACTAITTHIDIRFVDKANRAKKDYDRLAILSQTNPKRANMLAREEQLQKDVEKSKHFDDDDDCYEYALH